MALMTAGSLSNGCWRCACLFVNNFLHEFAIDVELFSVAPEYYFFRRHGENFSEQCGSVAEFDHIFIFVAAARVGGNALDQIYLLDLISIQSFDLAVRLKDRLVERHGD